MAKVLLILSTCLLVAFAAQALHPSYKEELDSRFEPELEEIDEEFENEFLTDDEEEDGDDDGDDEDDILVIDNDERIKEFDQRRVKGHLRKFQGQMLIAHNKLRQKHKVSKLKLSKKLNKKAQKWADHLASMNSRMPPHSKDRKYGENLFWGTGQYPPKDIVQFWYDEINLYNFRNPESQSNFRAGHFTQVVWKGTKKLGVGYAKGKDGTVYVVANYYPAGNMMGTFGKNVKPPT